MNGQYGNQHLEPLGMELEDSLAARMYVLHYYFSLIRCVLSISDTRESEYNFFMTVLKVLLFCRQKKNLFFDFIFVFDFLFSLLFYQKFFVSLSFNYFNSSSSFPPSFPPSFPLLEHFPSC